MIIKGMIAVGRWHRLPPVLRCPNNFDESSARAAVLAVGAGRFFFSFFDTSEHYN